MKLHPTKKLLHSKGNCDQNKKATYGGRLGGSVVEHLPFVQVMILGSWDQVPIRLLCEKPASPSAYVSVSLSQKLSKAYHICLYVPSTYKKSLSKFYHLHLSAGSPRLDSEWMY